MSEFHLIQTYLISITSSEIIIIYISDAPPESSINCQSFRQI
jgi:hypothetical protein